MATADGASGAAEERSGIQVLRRAAAVLRALQEHPGGLSLGEISRAAGLPRATVQRIVDTLAGEYFVTGVGAAWGIRLGPGLISLAAAAASDPVAEIARPFLAALARDTEETVDLSIFDRGKALFLDQIVGSQRLRAVSAIGNAFELHCSANGKAMLAALPAESLAALRRATLARCTPNTITSWNVLVRELTSVRRSEVAYDREEQSLGISAVGTAFRGSRGELYAISVPTPTQRFAGRERALRTALLACRRRLVAALGSVASRTATDPGR